MGWNTRPPFRGGEVYTQNEALKDPILKSVLGMKRPENVVVLGSHKRKVAYWVIEAKADHRHIRNAIHEAQERSQKINSDSRGKCQIITGVAGDPDTTHIVETQVLVGNEWKRLNINGRVSTGFISPDQAKKLLQSQTAELSDYEIDDELFNKKTSSINDILHIGGINKRNRAGVLACLLLALAQDESMPVNSDPTTLISDINARANRMLKAYGKESFFDHIEIKSPGSIDNHIKYKTALVQAIEALRGLNISSAINSGRDILGQFYEQFLQYANDAKELGIVFTPRHITTFAAKAINVRRNDIVFDPACGTGGFLVAALDKVKGDGGDSDAFKKGNLYGIEFDQLIATLAIVNMIFRGDGSSNIMEGDGLKKSIPKRPDKVLINPPFALKEKEWMFVDRALADMQNGGYLFAVLPTTCMASTDDRRGEITWRTELLKKHTLVGVVKLHIGLFLPHVKKGTYGVIIKAHIPHKMETDKVVWAVMEDGIVRSKLRSHSEENMRLIENAFSNYIVSGMEPTYSAQELDCSCILDDSEQLDLSPEVHIGRHSTRGSWDIEFIRNQRKEAELALSQFEKPEPLGTNHCKTFDLFDFITSFERGKSGRAKSLLDGDLPLISTQESINGISAFVDRGKVDKVYPSGRLTISTNGSSCCAFYHEYDFAANPDVFVITLKERFLRDSFPLFLCAAVNSQSWRFNYYRKFSQDHLKNLTIQLPVDEEGEIDFEHISSLVLRG